MTRTRRRGYVLAGLVLAACGVLTAVLLPGRSALLPLTPSFDGPSTGLRQTVIVPTLDTPLPDGKSAIWCGSFQLAWNELKGVNGGPVDVTGLEDITQRLNASNFTEGKLSAGTYYAAAGLARDGVADRIRADMGRLFPGVPVPDLEAGDAVIAYAYLRASVPFRLPYYEDWLRFRESSGAESTVRAFGIRKGDRGVDDLRDQVEVLFVRRGEDGGERPTAFALDLCCDSVLDQVVLARIPRGRTLDETIATVEEQAKQTRAVNCGFRQNLSTYDRLLIPAMAWRVEHRYAELEGPDRWLRGGRLDGLPVGRASQVIQFRLDKGGADLASKAEVVAKAGPTEYHLDGPYLLYLKRRGAAAPYFAMWVDNAELLAPWN